MNHFRQYISRNYPLGSFTRLCKHVLSMSILFWHISILNLFFFLFWHLTCAVHLTPCSYIFQKHVLNKRLQHHDTSKLLASQSHYSLTKNDLIVKDVTLTIHIFEIKMSPYKKGDNRRLCKTFRYHWNCACNTCRRDVRDTASCGSPSIRIQ